MVLSIRFNVVLFCVQIPHRHVKIHTMRESHLPFEYLLHVRLCIVML